MQNLVWKNDKNITTNLVEGGFKSEREIEEYLCNTGEFIDDDVFIIRNQIRAGNQRDIPDILAVDNDGNIIIMELKNTTVDEDILPQVLKYAIWAKTNPDSVKSLWLETKNRPDDLIIDWDNLSIKIVVIAPKIKKSVVRVADAINYELELIEIKKFFDGKNEFVLMSKIEDDKEYKNKITTKGKVEYNEEFYKSERNPNSVSGFLTVEKKIEKYCADKKWDLQRNRNRSYIGFKHDTRLVFGIHWLGTLSFGLFFRIPKSVAMNTKIKGIELLRYEDKWKQAVYIIDGKINLKDFDKVFQAAYKNIVK
ncbi:MAG: hypothetical protein HYY92_02080 [Parcubacteria group bacterium]|nr:hypothetical protein [Parcubacteria group bacterium]